MMPARTVRGRRRVCDDKDLAGIDSLPMDRNDQVHWVVETR